MITFRSKELQAAALFCSDDESRWVLNSVRFERKSENPPRLISTDGRALLVIETIATQSQDSEESFTMPKIVIPAIVAAAKRDAPIVACLEEGTIKIQSGEVILSVQPIEQGYPNWRAVIPSGNDADDKSPCCISGIYAEKFDKAVGLIGNYSMSFCGPLGPVVISFERCQAIGVLMPLRIGGEWGSALYRKLVAEKTPTS